MAEADRICGVKGLGGQDIDLYILKSFRGIIHIGLVGLSVDKRNSTGLISYLREKVKNDQMDGSQSMLNPNTEYLIYVSLCFSKLEPFECETRPVYLKLFKAEQARVRI